MSRKDKGNAIYSNLKKIGVKPETCTNFEMVAHGPLFPEVKGDKCKHKKRWSKVAALEKALADALECGGYKLLNTVRSKQHVDCELWGEVREAFARRFPKLC